MPTYRYLNAKEVMGLTNPPTGLTKARWIISEINKELKQRNCLVPCSYRAPEDLILVRLGLKGNECQPNENVSIQCVLDQAKT